MTRIKLATLAVAVLLATPAWTQVGPMAPEPMTTASLALPTSTQARTKFLSAGTGTTYITSLHLVPLSGATVTWSAGTGSNRATNNVILSGPVTYGSNEVVAWGTGAGALLVAPQSYDVCLTISGAAVGGSVSYGQF
jgi:hypothetical protein